MKSTDLARETLGPDGLTRKSHSGDLVVTDHIDMKISHDRKGE
jgi:hypothetical protein